MMLVMLLKIARFIRIFSFCLDAISDPMAYGW